MARKRIPESARLEIDEKRTFFVITKLVPIRDSRVSPPVVPLVEVLKFQVKTHL